MDWSVDVCWIRSGTYARDGVGTKVALAGAELVKVLAANTELREYEQSMLAVGIQSICKTSRNFLSRRIAHLYGEYLRCGPRMQVELFIEPCKS